MKRLAAMLLAFALLTSVEAYGNIRNDLVGEWMGETIRTLRDQKVKFTGLRSKTVRLKDGTHRTTGSANLKGIGKLRTESWSYTDGTSEGYAYVNGELTEVSEGTWRVRGNRIIFSDRTDGLNGTFNSNGYSLRVNRDKWVTYLTIQGGVRQTTTSVRIKKKR